MTLALAAFAFAANAQFVLGGNLGAFHTNEHTDEYADGDVTTDITIMPKIGYWLNDKMQVGAQLGWGMNYIRTYGDVATAPSNEDNYISSSRSRIMIAPYFRYNVAEWKNFTFFCEAQLNFTLAMDGSRYNNISGETSDVKNGYNTLGINVVPGLNYSLSEHVSVDLYLNIARLYWNTTSSDGESSHNWGVGANMTAQPFLGTNGYGLDGHLSVLTLGFNYAL